jgi:hypothetical protein
VLLQDPQHDIPPHFVIGFFQVNEDQMNVFLLFPVSLHKLPYQENCLNSQSPWHKTKLVFGDIGHFPYAMFKDSLP